MTGRQIAVHAAVIALCLAVLGAVAYPLLDVAALEIETLFVNLFEQQAVSLSWLAPIQAIILFGPLPMVILTGAWLGYALAAALGVGNPLAAGSLKIRRTVQVMALLSFVLASFPLSLAVATWIALEAFEWVEWLYNLNPTMEAVFRLVPPLLLPGAWLLAFRVSSLALGLGDSRSRSKRLNPVVRPIAATLTTLCIIATSTVTAAALPQAGRVLTAPSSQAFKDNCAGCHFRTAALNFARSPSAWADSVAQMQGLAGGSIPEEQLADITKWLSHIRSRSAKSVLQSRCSRCHGLTHNSWQRRSGEDWQMLVQRISRWSPVFYGPGIAETLSEELTRRYGDEQATLGLSEDEWQRMFEVARVCSTCHSISWNAREHQQDTMEQARILVERMNQKMAEPLSAEKLETITADYLELISDMDRFDQLFPHDRPLPEPKDTAFEDRRPKRGGNY